MQKCKSDTMKTCKNEKKKVRCQGKWILNIYDIYFCE